jgi:ABC-type Fe3+/spermidine/putrescine transport system ATPase subunit
MAPPGPLIGTSLMPWSYFASVDHTQILSDMLSDTFAPTAGSIRLQGREIPGEAVAVIGPNGAGKNILMRVISGLIRPIRGSKQMEGIDLVTTPSYRIVDLRIEHVPENRRLFPRMTVEDNLRMGGFNPPGNRPRWGAEMQIHVQGSSRYHIILGIPLSWRSPQVCMHLQNGDCLSLSAVRYHPSTDLSRIRGPDRAEAHSKHRRWNGRLRPFLDFQATRLNGKCWPKAERQLWRSGRVEPDIHVRIARWWHPSERKGFNTGNEH